ncbi:MAG TPA: hypothetical protein VFO86_09085, partial [Terriglobia bacterium]|nr:hypothetical protein [Terriglobia bacterium]
EVTPGAYLESHPEVGTHVSRDLWYDNDTPKPVFDKNELKLWWGGEHNHGIDARGHYTFSVEHMTSHGSFHNGLSADARELAKEGNLKLLLSVSEGTQAHPIEVPIDADGTVHIDPQSEAAKLFAVNKDGQAVFKGRFAEIAQSIQVKDGVDHVRVLATYEGKGLDVVRDIGKLIEQTPHNTLTMPSDYLFDPPPVIPIYARTPLEPINGRKPPKPFLAFYYGDTEPGKEQMHAYEAEQSPRLKDNPDAELDPRTEGEAYLKGQKPEHLKKIEMLAAEAGTMADACRVSICIPVAGHHESANIERTLSAYLNQTADPKSFELVLFVNQPDTTPNGETVVSDGTLEKIEVFRKAHPE